MEPSVILIAHMEDGVVSLMPIGREEDGPIKDAWDTEVFPELEALESIDSIKLSEEFTYELVITVAANSSREQA